MAGGTNGQELVVVGVDGSAESVRALGWVAGYAGAAGARVRAVLAWRCPGRGGAGPGRGRPGSGP
jgi:Universal stress protein family